MGYELDGVIAAIATWKAWQDELPDLRIWVERHLVPRGERVGRARRRSVAGSRREGDDAGGALFLRRFGLIQAIQERFDAKDPRAIRDAVGPIHRCEEMRLLPLKASGLALE